MSPPHLKSSSTEVLQAWESSPYSTLISPLKPEQDFFGNSLTKYETLKDGNLTLPLLSS